MINPGKKVKLNSESETSTIPNAYAKNKISEIEANIDEILKNDK